MKKDQNNNSMNGTATMPSYFPCIKSSESHPLADWLYLKSVITSSPELRMMTETYRKRLAISKQFADQYKPEMPAITVSALMDGYGRQLANFLKPTYMLQLDFDHVKKEDMEHLIQLVRGDSHTMVEYITVSGKGFRVFCAYRPVDDDDISVLELFDAVLQSDGVLMTYDHNTLTKDALAAMNAYQTWVFGPALLDENGQPKTKFQSRVQPENPRTALGYYEPGHYAFITVDGRSGASAGMTMTQLSQLCADLGMTRAYNMDGGQSSVLLARDGVLNVPFRDGRSVSDILAIRELPQG